MTALPRIPAAIQDLCEQHLTRVAEAVVERDLEPVWISFDQLLEMRLLALRFTDPQSQAELDRLNGRIDELHALRDVIGKRLVTVVGDRKGIAEDPRERSENARGWLGSLSGASAGPVG